jgi:Zn-finger nucleic acid-binding protein
MNEVRAEAVTGYMILLDQCSRCGGIWCDRWELYPVTAAAVRHLDGVDKDALQQPTQAADTQLECPRCRARMFRFRDPTLPADARIERCPNCDGMWFNRGELRRVKERHVPSGAATAPAASQTVSDPQLEGLVRRALANPQARPTVRNLDDFDAPREVEADATEMRAALTSSAAWLIARAALRLLLHI